MYLGKHKVGSWLITVLFLELKLLNSIIPNLVYLVKVNHLYRSSLVPGTYIYSIDPSQSLAKLINYILLCKKRVIRKEGRKEEGREGRKEGRKGGRNHITFFFFFSVFLFFSYRQES